MKSLAFFLFAILQCAFATPEAQLVSFAVSSASKTNEVSESRILLIWEIKSSAEQLTFVRGRVEPIRSDVSWAFHPYLPPYYIHVGDYHGEVMEFSPSGTPKAPGLPVAAEWVHTPRYFYELKREWGFQNHEGPYDFGFSIPVSVINDYSQFHKKPVSAVTIVVSIEYFTVRKDRKGFERAGELKLEAKNLRINPTGEVLVENLAEEEKWPDFKEFGEEPSHNTSTP